MLEAGYAEETLRRRSNSRPKLSASLGAPPGSPPGALQVLPAIGSRVIVGVQKTELAGTVHFTGPTFFAEGDWIGVELDTPSGKNDGSVGGTRYFKSRPLHGIFARPRLVRPLSASESGAVSKPPVQQSSPGKVRKSRSSTAASAEPRQQQGAAIDGQAAVLQQSATASADVIPETSKVPQKQSRVEGQSESPEPHAEEILEAISLAVSYRKELDRLLLVESQLNKELSKLRPLEPELKKARTSIAAMQQEKADFTEQISKLVAESEECKKLRAAFSEQELELKAFRAAAVTLQSEMEMHKLDQAKIQEMHNLELAKSQEMHNLELAKAQKSIEQLRDRSREMTEISQAQQQELSLLREGFHSLQRLAQRQSPAITSRLEDASKSRSERTQASRVDAEGMNMLVSCLEEQLTSQEQEIAELRRTVDSLSIAVISTFSNSDETSSTINSLRLQMETLQSKLAASSPTEWPEKLEEQEAHVAFQNILDSEHLDQHAQEWLIGTFHKKKSRRFLSDGSECAVDMLSLGSLKTGSQRLQKAANLILHAPHKKALASMAQAGAELQEELALLDSWRDFDIFRLADRAKPYPLAIVGHALFAKHDVIDCLSLAKNKLETFLLSLDEKYLADNPYHNSLHAADVVQTVHMFLLHLPLSDLEVCSSLMAAACHDVGHPGVTNDFRVKQADDDSITYSDKSVNENMHCALIFRMLQCEDHNFLQSLSSDQYALLRKSVVNMILATDMIRHFSHVQNVLDLVARQGPDISSWEDRQPFLDILVHSADISNVGKPRPLALKWTELVLQEFFAQGDRERTLNRDISPLCDRETVSKASSQIGFIAFIVKPAFEGMNRVKGLPDVQVALDNMNSIHEYWTKEKEKEKEGNTRKATDDR